MKQRQQGLAAVEFAVVGATAMVLFFGALETGRTLFVITAANEATRRAARVAVVSTAAEAKAAALVYSDTLHGLTEDHIDVTYLDVTGAAAAMPAARAFVTVRLLDYPHSLFIPGLPLTLVIPQFATTLPVESQGVDPD